MIVIEGDGVYHAIAAGSVTRITLVVAAPNVRRIGVSDRTARIFISGESAPVDIDADICADLTALWVQALAPPDPPAALPATPSSGPLSGSA